MEFMQTPKPVHSFKYSSYTENPPLSIDRAYVRDNNVEVSSNDEDMTIHQLMNLFKSYCLAIGYSEKSFNSACEYFLNEL